MRTTRRVRTVVGLRVVLAVVAGLLPGTVVAALPAPVVEALARHGVPEIDASVYVQALDAPTPLVNHRGETSRNPASVMKLLTTLAALEILGPTYTWATEVYASGPVRQGRLEGDLILKGHGDPYLTPERFWRLLASLRAYGIREVSGDLVLDQSHFAPVNQGRGDFDDRPHRAYNALPAALSLAFQATRLRFFPDPDGQGVRVVPEPPAPNLTVQNLLQWVDRPCTGRHHRPVLVIHDQGREATVRLRGSYASGCQETSLTRLILDPDAHLAGAFLGLWAEMGGALGGTWRTGVVPADARLLVREESPPLGEVIRGMNKFSNNLMSRHLLLTMGAEAHGAPATLDKGRRAVQAWLAEAGLDLPGLVLDNGSGLSRDARLTAPGVGRLLLAAFQGPHMADFMASLSLVGSDGTMRKRLRDGDLVGRARIKTGSLDHVNTMAGYVLDRHGRRWAVVLLVNHQGLQAWQGKQVQDALLRWVHQGPDGPRMASGPCPGLTVAGRPAGGEDGS